jgi:GLPGLI family protein
MNNFKKIILITVIFYGIGVVKFFSQTYRFIYELQIKFTDKTEKMNMVLDIDKNNVKFYDYSFLKMDSISRKTGENYQTNTESDQLILRKANTFENKSFHDHGFSYFVIKSKDEMNWKVEPETKTIGEYRLQRASTNFGGRNWTAWFCTEIPFHEGPYKFRGLPGLIFELRDNNDNFVYSLIKSINLPKTFDTADFLETHYGNQPISVSLEQYHKVLLVYYDDTVFEMKEILNNGGTIIMGDNEKITTLEQLDQKRRWLQEMAKKNNNPVELDKAVPYPD